MHQKYQQAHADFIEEFDSIKSYDDLSKFQDKLSKLDQATLNDIDSNQDWLATRSVIDLMLADQNNLQTNPNFLAIKSALRKLKSTFKPKLYHLFNNHYKDYFLEKALALTDNVEQSLQSDDEKIKYALRNNGDFRKFDQAIKGMSSSNLRGCCAVSNSIKNQQLKEKANNILCSYRTKCFEDFKTAILGLNDNFNEDSFRGIQNQNYCRFLKGEQLVDALINFLQKEIGNAVLQVSLENSTLKEKIFEILSKVFQENTKESPDFLAINTEYEALLPSLIALKIALNPDNEQAIAQQVVAKITKATEEKNYSNIDMESILSQLAVIKTEQCKNLIKGALRNHCKAYFKQQLDNLVAKKSIFSTEDKNEVLNSFLDDRKCQYVGGEDDEDNYPDQKYQKVFLAINSIKENNFNQFHTNIKAFVNDLKDYKTKLTQIYMDLHPISWGFWFYISIVAARFCVGNFLWDTLVPGFVKTRFSGSSDSSSNPEKYNSTILFFDKSEDAIKYFLAKGSTETKHPPPVSPG